MTEIYTRKTARLERTNNPTPRSPTMLFSNGVRLPHLLLSTLLILQQPLQSQADYSAKACNNSPHLCNLSYGAITYLGTHNSPFIRDQSTSFSTSGNQYFNVTVQLDAGVRLLQGQLHKDSNGGEPRLCHSTCTLMDGGTLANWLSQIKAWMDQHSSEGMSSNRLVSHFRGEVVLIFVYSGYFVDYQRR